MKHLTWVLLVAVIILTCATMYSLFTRERVVFVDIGRLQESYQLKKDLEEKGKGKLLALKNVLDSLGMVKQLQPESSTYTALDTNIARLQFEFKRMYDQTDKEISETIWKRLNPLMEKFGKSEHYKMIIGANGAGTILYGDKDCDITDRLIKYVNHDYAPGK